MRIAIATVQVPFEYGGAEFLADNLKNQLVLRGHEAEIVTIPFKWDTAKSLTNSIRMSRLLDLSEMKGKSIDLLISLKFPMYYVDHDNKVLWLLHQHREAYELWESQFDNLARMPHGHHLRQLIIRHDNRFIGGCKKTFTISQTVSKRLKKYNNIHATPLYHPPHDYEKLYPGQTGDYIFCPARLEELKRQHLLVEALRYTKTPVKVVLAGKGKPEYMKRLQSMIETYSLQDRVRLLGWISEAAKRKYYADALAVYYGPYQEDYGYVTLEGLFSGKPLLTHVDSGGPLEFVKQGQNGFVLESDLQLLAETLDLLHEKKHLAKSLGMNGLERIKQSGINWDSVIEKLTGGN